VGRVLVLSRSKGQEEEEEQEDGQTREDDVLKFGAKEARPERRIYFIPMG
jgi:hypothetical protein